MLDSFHTTLAFHADDLLLKLAPSDLRKQLLRRTFPCSKDKIRLYPWRETGRLIAQRANWNQLLTPERGIFSLEKIGKELDFGIAQYMAREAGRRSQQQDKLTGVYGYEDLCKDSFTMANKLGIASIYELCTAYWTTVKAIVTSECERLPEWAFTMDLSNFSESKTERKTEELERADLILCISNFVFKSLPPHITVSKKCRVVEFGCPPSPWIRDHGQPNKKMRILFVGWLSQRKGLADLLTAMRILNRSDVELIVLGQPTAPLSFYKQFFDFQFVPPCAHDEVLRTMAQCDVFVFPALCEGRGHAQLEALSCGLPVISTLNATADDFIEEGKNGFIVPIQSPHAIAEKLDWLASHPSERAQMGAAAKLTADGITWHRYRTQLIAALKSATEHN
ncbi:MAG: glycosyltransferase family 4 protein [Candidatus Obscuribacterales bacterium]|nr:glycosyltransferase family 4 protein [Candidatus Obscuribacterales bacterium]